jgi:hypothetical protein
MEREAAQEGKGGGWKGETTHWLNQWIKLMMVYCTIRQAVRLDLSGFPRP